MVKEMMLVNPELMTATALWRVVIARAIQDWLSKSCRLKREAERYLFENSTDLALVCASAGIDVLRLRSCLNKMRGRTLENVLAVAA
jgi:hypothetical protein